jgi:Spy/CpxP family protein refolding chaperone
MKRVCALVVATLVVLALGTLTATALPPINVQWHEKYSALKDAVVKTYGAEATDKCNVCHIPGKGKKERSAYGMAVSKFITKAQITKIKEDAGDNADAAAEATKKYILEGLAKVEGEKAADGKSYGDAIKAGKLPQ